MKRCFMLVKQYWFRWIRFFMQIKKNVHQRCHEREQLKRIQQQKHIRREKRYKQAIVSNPYLQSKDLFSEMYGGLQVKLQNMYRIVFILSCVIVIAMVGLVMISGQSQVQPFPFVIHGNEIITLDQNENVSFNQVKPKMAFYFAKQFIRQARHVSVDSEVNAANKIAAYSFVKGEAVSVLTRFFETHDPDVLSKQYVKDIHITSVLALSKKTLNIRWNESWRNVQTGEIVKQERFISELSYQFEAPSQRQAILKNNPLGFYITHLSWSSDDVGSLS